MYITNRFQLFIGEMTGQWVPFNMYQDANDQQTHSCKQFQIEVHLQLMVWRKT